MSNTQIQLRKIVTATIIIIVMLLISAIVLSVLWPLSWNPLLGSLFLNIASSLMGVLVGILIAIFVVERYLQHQRRETQRKEQLRRGIYMEWWRGWIHGGLSVLTAIIMHLSFFLLYGTRKWQALMISDDDQTQVPEMIGDFVFWLIDTKDKLRPGVTKEKLAQFEKEFNETPKSATSVTRRDLGILVNYIETCASRIRDQLFLFQPFIDEHFELASSLVLFARSLDDTAHDSKFSLALTMEEGKSPSSFHLDDKGQAIFHSLGKKAVEVSKLILADYNAKGADEPSIDS